MKKIAWFLLVIVMSACEHSSVEMQQFQNIEEQIKKTLDFLNADPCGKDQNAMVKFITVNSDRLIMLTADNENPGTSVVESNKFFFESLTIAALSNSGLRKVEAGMPSRRRKLTIRQNELWLLNECAANCPEYGKILSVANEPNSK